MSFLVKNINVIHEKFVDIDNFFIQGHCEISFANQQGGEFFEIKIISPKAIATILDNTEDDYPYEFGRGYLMVKEYNKTSIIKILQRFINRLDVKSWDDLQAKLSHHFNWA